MKLDEYSKFSQLWADAHEAMPAGKVLSKGAMGMVFEALMQYSYDDIAKAVRHHVAFSKFAPSPNDIVELLQPAQNKHISADEAWSIALKSFDEAETIVLTREILEAKASIQDIFDSGDTVGARMGFRAIYDRLIKNSNNPVWTVSLGTDKAGRIEAVRHGIAIGRLPKGSDQRYLPDVPQSEGPIAGLLAGKVSTFPKNKEFFKACWNNVSNYYFSDETSLEDYELEKRREEKRQYQIEIERRKKEALEYVESKLKKEIL